MRAGAAPPLNGQREGGILSRLSRKLGNLVMWMAVPARAGAPQEKDAYCGIEQPIQILSWDL